MNKAVFLDKDGTINEDLGYLDHPDKIKLLPRSAEAIKLLNEAGYKVLVISNQAGVARGIVTEDMVQSIDKRLHKEVLKGGGYLDGIYYCPHHPEHGLYPYRSDCECRKPKNGLLKRASKEHNIDISASYMIGDKVTDIEAGNSLKARTILVLTGKGKEESKKILSDVQKPAHIADDLFSAVSIILKGDKH